MNTTALKLEKTLRDIGETWAKDEIKRIGAVALRDKAMVNGYDALIAKSTRAMKAITTLLNDNPDLHRTHAVFVAGNGAASAVGRAAGHLSA